MVRQPSREDGFSLVEVLVVVLILGVLATLAVNTYLNRKADALDRQVWSDLRNSVVLVESYFAENSTYIGAPGPRGFVETVGVTVTVATSPPATSTRFCLEGDHEAIEGAGTVDWHYDNVGGRVERGPCS